ncbi:mas-related G-protein coupled receptor member X3 [Echinops telfairi]|uniref:Mas-related G protein-coupled receptor G1 n=1 Tax=Echinops telfairi TaxID=9371 RepID=W8W3I6_ECHTE|nr:mas-related G-protein coupled receptor member X3 [Echinops telfairi]CDG86296.1 TPA: Mas-related G protein-coupled receptor G1 [Echinops telfairi]
MIIQQVLNTCLCSRNTSGSFLSPEPPFADQGNQVSTLNESYPTVDYVQTVILTTLTAIIAPFGLAGNTVVIWLLGFRARRNPFSVYVLNLAVADCLFICIMIIFSLIWLIKYLHDVSISFDVRDSLSKMIWVFYFTDMSMVSVIGTERCLCTLYPIWYRCRRPRYTSAGMCTLLWALSLMLTFMAWIYCEISWDWCLSFRFFFSTCLIFLFVVLCGSSLVLLMKVFCGSRRRKMTRLIVTILITVLVCLLCGLPFGTFWIIFQDRLTVLLYFWSLFLSCVNSSANPIIYFFVGSFRQQQQQRLKPTLRMVLQRALQDTPEGEEPGGAPPQ